jgi:hypothetical protein
MFKPTFFEALCEILGPESGTILGGGKTDGPISEIIFNDETEKPTDEEVQTKLASMISTWEAQEYTRNRVLEYPNIGDQLDYMFHNGFDKWKEDIVQPVKDKYPKPE